MQQMPTDLLEAYWDESGRADDPNCSYLSLSGLVGAAKNWSLFSQAWQAALDGSGLPYFHMRDFANYKGAFKDRREWSEERRQDLLNQLLAAIAVAAPSIHGAVVDLAAWRALTDAERGLWKHNPWYCCMQECVRLLGVHCGVGQLDARCVFSQQAEFRGTAAALWAVLRQTDWIGCDRIGEFQMADMRTVLPLQAADLVAYELTRFGKTRARGEIPRYPLRVLLGIDPHAFVSQVDAAKLREQIDGAMSAE
jgi:hypothetical protein